MSTTSSRDTKANSLIVTPCHSTGDTTSHPIFELIVQCSILFNKIQLVVSVYSMESLRLSSSVHSRNTRFSNCNFISPTSTIGLQKAVNYLQLLLFNTEIVYLLNLNSNLRLTLKRVLWDRLYNEQLSLPHFNP